MKNGRFLLTLLTIAAISCGKDNGSESPEPAPTPAKEFLTVEPPTLDFTSEGGEKTVTVSSSSEWEASSDQSWLTVAKAADGKNFTAVAEANGSTDNARTAIVTVSNKAKSVNINVGQDKAEPCWGVVSKSGAWANDIKMKEVFPGIWMSPLINFNGSEWKIRFDGDWNKGNIGYWSRGYTLPRGRFMQVIVNGDYLEISDNQAIAVYNENNGTIGTLEFGVSGIIASFKINNDKDVPMADNGSGVWYSIPIALTTSDNITIRSNADPNRIARKDIKVDSDGIYLVVYDSNTGSVSFSKEVWSTYGNFNNWEGDEYMFYTGGSRYYLFNRHYSNGWKLKKGGNAEESFGGTYEWNSPFPIFGGGGEIVVEKGVDAAGFNVIFDSQDQSITINQEII